MRKATYLGIPETDSESIANTHKYNLGHNFNNNSLEFTATRQEMYPLECAMITLHGQLICATEADTDIVRANLPEHIRLSRVQANCLVFQVEPADGPLI